MTDTKEDFLAHYGTPRHSGRYPWGSGDDPYQDGLHFTQAYDELRKKGMTEKEIAKGLGFDSTADLRARLSISSSDIRAAKQRQLTNLLDKGMSMNAAAKQMGISESSGRALIDPVVQERANRTRVTANILKDNVEKYRYVQIGKGTENHMGISDTQLKTALAILKTEGYTVYYDSVRQIGTGKDTSLKILTKDSVEWTEVHANQDKIHTIQDYVDPNTGEKAAYPGPIVNVNPKRIGVVYAEDGGASADGVIYLRPGVPDISLGNAQYAQVRIAVDDTHYIKGMAMYKDDLPKGTDILFNTNKSNTGNKLDALKPQASDENNPFGSITRPKTYVDPKTGETKRSPLNIVNQEGDWYTWSNKFSSQFLSKQTPQLAKQQLELTTNAKKADLDDILALTNPVVKKKLLETFADNVDSSAVKLKAVGLPRTATHVILPINSLKDTEIYAPKYNDGEVVVLVRHPHGGIFEIPQLTVNNSNKEARRSINGAKDAVGINANVASRLSGADFDGDTVLVIPNGSGKIKTSAALAGLKDFDTKQYKLPDDSTKGLKGYKNPGAMKQQLMGDVSNLITDMTIKGANQNEIARAVRHSMVVIDAEKHNLDYKQSAIDNNIKALKKDYQGGANKGASTLISKTTSELNEVVKKPRPSSLGGPVDQATGEKMYLKPGDVYVDRTGKTVTYENPSFVTKSGETKLKTERTTKGAATRDARSLISDEDTVIENVYADHANGLKALANTARKEALAIKNIPSEPSAKKAYKTEVDSLNAKLNIALKNAPLERQAQIVAHTLIKARVDSSPEPIDKAQLKKISGQALSDARVRVGAVKQKIDITDNEWAAIQSGAISPSKLSQIINNADIDAVRARATPRDRPVMNPANVALARSMMNSGYTAAEIATRLGISTSTLYSALSD